MVVWDSDGLQRCLDVPRDLASVARLAITAPSSNICPHAQPYDLDLMSRFIARTPGWARLWMASNSIRQ